MNTKEKIELINKLNVIIEDLDTIWINKILNYAKIIKEKES